MTPKHQACHDKLQTLGCPVMPGGNWSAGSVFEISAETHADASNGLPWADYYWIDPKGEQAIFGVNKLLDAELERHGLYAEWINPGVLGVYPI